SNWPLVPVGRSTYALKVLPGDGSPAAGRVSVKVWKPVMVPAGRAFGSTTRTVPWPGVLVPVLIVSSLAYSRDVTAFPTAIGVTGSDPAVIVTVASGWVSGLFAQLGYGPK